MHVNHMEIEKTRLLAHDSIFSVNIIHDIENAVKNYPVCFEVQVTQPMDKMIYHEIPSKLWETVGADVCTVNDKHYLHIADYHSEFAHYQ